ncbi:uncharacterized protein LAESUDRAFT_105659 [Laetiporus sulphureus 93-53]|uniref:Uncharacterized protein n=1 Tax=Laetiporus sulphureus 93-53 TaxID=1314785 RepID=A0A165EUB9_9APHY|nr:uncharacterized protein LAESUDRAFT_105659 [Laetiporus sulphureus 93-53]KZT07779.1 hypothetical protein LAESUDRAFT_105659 [Laetiporus sulphureus 93-53]
MRRRRAPAVISPLSASTPDSTARRRSSVVSQELSPRTPPNRDSPSPLFGSIENRHSGSGWSSSAYDEADDPEVEWTTEEVLRLSRTLDALPVHLITPFCGPVPPSNLLDKLALAVVRSKGAFNWPHSFRATRTKIAETARLKAKNMINDGAGDTIAEEGGSDVDILQQTTNTGPRMSLRRHQGTSFVQNDVRDPKADEGILRLSDRLQRTERFITNPPPHAHAPGADRPPSPPFDIAGRDAFFHSTPSSDTLESIGSDSKAPRRLQRSMSDISHLPGSLIALEADRPTRLKRTDSFAAPVLHRRSLKRAPSYGMASRRSSGAMSLGDNESEDEEEKLRSAKAKKTRVKAATTPQLSSPQGSLQQVIGEHDARQSSDRSSIYATSRRPAKQRANLHRNPSILGPELPRLQDSPVTLRRSARLLQSSQCSQDVESSPTKGLISRMSRIATTSADDSPEPRTPRRPKGGRLPLRPFSRRISFSHLSPVAEEHLAGTYPDFMPTLGNVSRRLSFSPAAEENRTECCSDDVVGLGSAIQLH